MEPSLIGWEWHEYPAQTITINVYAAMEPSLIGWEWGWQFIYLRRYTSAAMEPSLIGWEWCSMIASFST